MEDIVLRYQEGEEIAREELLEEILELHNYTITRAEAVILLHKKYGKAKIF